MPTHGIGFMRLQIEIYPFGGKGLNEESRKGKLMKGLSVTLSPCHQKGKRKCIIGGLEVIGWRSKTKKKDQLFTSNPRPQTILHSWRYAVNVGAFGRLLSSPYHPISPSPHLSFQ